jgi:hypothetical protein
MPNLFTTKITAAPKKMDTNSINKYLNLLFRNSKVKFGVVACDELHLYINSNKYPICIVSNNMPSDDPGEHWVAFFQTSKTSPIEFFCSYGRKINDYTLAFKQFVNSLGV